MVFEKKMTVKDLIEQMRKELQEEKESMPVVPKAKHGPKISSKRPKKPKARKPAKKSGKKKR